MAIRPMKPNELGELVTVSRLPLLEAAAELGIAYRSLRNYLDGDRTIPLPVARLARLIWRKESVS